MMDEYYRKWYRKFSADFKNLNEVREFVGEAARICGFTREDVYHIQVAVDEAFSNIVEHATAGDTPDDIVCVCQVKPTELVISLSDYGRSFNPEQISNPPVKAPLGKRGKGGLGLFFMRHWMDEIHFDVVQENNLGRQRNVLTMIKKRNVAHV